MVVYNYTYFVTENGRGHGVHRLGGAIQLYIYTNELITSHAADLSGASAWRDGAAVAAGGRGSRGVVGSSHMCTSWPSTAHKLRPTLRA